MFNTAQELIFDRYKNPLFAGDMNNPDLKAEGSNPVCGDEVILYLRTSYDGIIGGVKHTTRACAVCTAATDLLAEHILKKHFSIIGEIKNEEIVEWLDIPLSPLRLKCALLPLEALRKALQLEKT